MLIGLVRPRLRTLRTIGARGIKTWRAFGAPSYFLRLMLYRLGSADFGD